MRANVNALTHIQDSPLNLASWKGHIDTVRFLLGAKADVTILDRENRIPLQLATEYGHADCVAALIAAGSDIHAVDKDGTTLIAFSCCWRAL